jgi:hypothetical protein
MDDIVKMVGMAVKRPVDMLAEVLAKVLGLLKELLEDGEVKRALEALFRAAMEALVKLLMASLGGERIQDKRTEG